MASSIVSYWDLLSTSSEERRIIINLLYYIDVDSAHHLQEPKSLSLGLTKAVSSKLNLLYESPLLLKLFDLRCNSIVCHPNSKTYNIAHWYNIMAAGGE